MANTLAYYDMTEVTAAKSLMLQAPGAGTINILL